MPLEKAPSLNSRPTTGEGRESQSSTGSYIDSNAFTRQDSADRASTGDEIAFFDSTTNGVVPLGRNLRHPSSGQIPKCEDEELLEQALAFQGAAEISLVERGTGYVDQSGVEEVSKAMEIVLEDGVTLTVDLDSGEKRLIELGYTQTLQRDLTGFELYAAGICCVGPFVGIVPYYGLAFAQGGPVAVVWYWWIPGIFANFMAMSLAEIASSLPLASSMYFWTAHLAPLKIRPFAAWMTGWLEFIGIAVGTGGTVLAGVHVAKAVAELATSVYDPSTNTWAHTIDLTPTLQFACVVVVMAAVALLNFARVKTLGQVLGAAATFQILLSFVIIICVPSVAPTRQSASFVFTTHLDNWIGSAPTLAYSVVIALLFPQYALYSMDTPAHISEEAKRADITTPIAMVGSLATVTVIEWLMIVAMTFSIQSVDSLSDPGTVTQGAQYFIQILWDAFYGRYGSGVGAMVILGLIYLGLFSCSVAQVLTGARVAYALARDKGMPFASVFSRIDSRKVPIPAILLTCAVALISLTPHFFSDTAYYSVTSMATIGWFSAYGFPMFLRIILPESRFRPGPFYMAKTLGVTGGKAIHLLGLLYVMYTICSFMLPYAFPVTWENLNYAPFITAAVLGLILGWWVLDAHNWFEGPPVTDKAYEGGGEVINDAPVEWYS